MDVDGKHDTNTNVLLGRDRVCDTNLRQQEGHQSMKLCEAKIAFPLNRL